MNLKSLGISSALALLVATAACTQSTPTRPSDTSASGTTASVTDATTGVTLTSPKVAGLFAKEPGADLQKAVDSAASAHVDA